MLPVSAMRAADRRTVETRNIAPRIPGTLRDPSGRAAGGGAAPVEAPLSSVAALDAHLARLARREARGRLALGRLTAAFCDAQAHHQLGFARLGDYTRERLGLSAREVQSVAAVARTSVALPRLTAAFRAGELSWTKLRLLSDVARPEDEQQWLAEARGRPARALRARIREILDPYADRPASDFDPDAEDAIEGETPVRVRIACPRHVRRRWHHAVELARRMMGEQAPVWRAAEAIAAEALAGAPRRPHAVPGCPEGAAVAAPGCRDAGEVPDAGATHFASAGDAPPPRVPPDPISSADGASVPLSTADGARAPVSTAGGASAPPAPSPAAAPRPWRPPVDPAALDARLQRVLVVLRQLDAEIGQALAIAVARGVPRAVGCRSVAAYAHARLGISAGKARTLLALDRRARRVPDFAAAYARGELSWSRALTLLPVVTAATADAWVARAQAITVRALEREVEDTLDRWDATPAAGMPAPPPPEAAAGVGGARRGAGPAEADPDERVGGPQPDIACDVKWVRVPGFASGHPLPRPGRSGSQMPRSRSWRRTRSPSSSMTPSLRSDGWRWAVPACAGRRSLHDHHIRFRSRGGDNHQANRVTVCAWHHLRGIHTGRVRATGTAPDALEWALGIDRDGRAWRRFKGDRYLR